MWKRRILGAIFKEIDVSTRVPQGGVLSPLLFNIMIRDFSHINRNKPLNGLALKLFPDDIVVHFFHKKRNKSRNPFKDFLTESIVGAKLGNFLSLFPRQRLCLLAENLIKKKNNNVK